MENEKMFRKLQFRIKLWLVGFILYNIIGSGYFVVYQHHCKNIPIDLLSAYPITTVIMMVVFFIPLVLSIYRYSKILEIRKYRYLSFFFLLFYGLWTFITIIAMLIEMNASQ